MLGMGLLPQERQRVWHGLLDVQQCDILAAWGCCYHRRDLLKGNRKGLSFSTSENPLWNDSDTGILVPLRFLENAPDCLR